MNLKGSELKINMRGEEVELLQNELEQLGFNILPNEIEEKRFGKSTRDAIRDFQKRHILDETGQVDEKAATSINREIDLRELLGHYSTLKVSEEIAELLDSADFERRKAPQLRLIDEPLTAGAEGENIKQLHETLQEVGSMS